MHRVISVLRNWVIGGMCVLLAACSAPLVIVKPLDVSQANESARLQFEVNKAGNYRFALLFVRGNSLAEPYTHIDIWGDYDHEGVAIPIHLRVLKDGQVYFDEKLVTAGAQWGQAVEYEGRNVDAAVRLIRFLKLVPGSYAVEVSTLEDREAFLGISSFVKVANYNPKH